MKTNIKFILVALVAFTAFSSVSCSKDDNNDSTPAVDNTISGVASRTSNLSLLVKALTKTNLVTTLQGAGPFTVFAPTDAAFIAAGYNAATIDALPASEVPALKNLLLNHVVSGAVQSTGLVNDSYIKTLATTTASGTNTLSMYVTVSASGVFLNDNAKVITPNTTASNGVIHIVDEVITLPTIVDHATANDAFTTLVSLLNRAGQPNFETILAGTGPFTVFAPTNAAFTALDTELAPGGIASVSDADITKVLQYHVVAGNKLSSTLTNNLSVTTNLGQLFTVQSTINPVSTKIKDARNRVSDVVLTDVQCSNGVIHVLSKVLLPTL